MKKKNLHSSTLSILGLIVFLNSCQTLNKRIPSSTESYQTEWQELRDLHLEKAQLEASIVNYEGSGRDSKVKLLEAKKNELEVRIKEIEQGLPTIEAKDLVFTHKSENWRMEKEFIDLTDINLYALPNNVQFSISTYEAKNTEVVLSHKFLEHVSSVVVLDKSTNTTVRPEIEFQVKCDAPIKFNYLLLDKKVAANETHRFYIGDGSKSSFSLDSSFESCQFTFVNPVERKRNRRVYGFKIVNETKQLKFMDHLLSTTEVCSLKKNSPQMIDSAEFSNMTCPTSYDSIDILPQPEDSLKARVMTLLGHELPADFIKNGDPYAPLDFKDAPHFDAILLSYLVYRADFYGTLLARLLNYHADHGAFVRILTTRYISLPKDKLLFEKEMAGHPNIKFGQYQFDDKQKSGTKIDQIHRTNHAKMFIAYSKENSKNSIVILGGKNVHDGFVFKKPADVSKFPEIVNYVSGDEAWAYWRDFEMVVHGQDYAESMVRHYMDFYHMNKKDLVMQRPSITIAKADAPETSDKMIRHYISIPFKDETNLNQFYAKMIDTSNKKLLISSPYFRPVKEIAEALERAVKRGVDITIITRLDLKGDTADFIIGDVNKDGVNQFYKDIKVYEYTEPNVILHSKLIMIDDKTTFISSVNLNKRSFYHDYENGSLVNDSEFTIKMGNLYKEYLKLSTLITEKKKIVFWKKWLIDIFDKLL